MKSVSVTQARKDLCEIFDDVNFGKERVVLTNRRKRVAIVPIEDLEALQALEDAEDIAVAEERLREYEKNPSIAISHEEMLKRFG